MHPARELENRREASGACILCGVQIPTGASRKRTSGRGPTRHICRPCLDRKCAAAAAIDHRRLEQGLCVRCGIPLVNRTVRGCAHCRSRERRWYALRNNKPVPQILPPRPPPPPPPRTRSPLPGMRPEELRAIASEPAPGMRADRPLTGRPQRACSNCGELFVASIRRRMLCAPCFKRGGDGPMAA